jgi:hypothetical protein
MTPRSGSTKPRVARLPRADKPLIEMTKKELQRACDEIGLGNTFAILQEARHGKNQDITIAAAVLRCSNGEERLAFRTDEYGDLDGVRTVKDFIEEVHRTPGLLADGETLTFRLLKATCVEVLPEARA